MTLERNLLSKALIQTNPKLTGNIKITVDSSNKIWLNSIDANDSLSQTRFKRFPIRENENYPAALNRFLLDGKFPTDILYQIRQEENPTNLKKSLDEQFYQFYSAGAGALVDKNYEEDFYCFAPIYIRDILPTHFVIFKVPGAYTKNNNVASADLVPGIQYRVNPVSSTWTFSYNDITYDNLNYPTGFTFTAIENVAYTVTGEVTVSEIGDSDDLDFSDNPANFNESYLKNAKIIKTFDLKNSPIGKFLNNCINDPQYPSAPLEVNFESDKLSYWRGAAYKNGVYASKGEDLSTFYSTEKTIKSHDEYITLGYERNSLIYPYIYNLEFLFNDNEDENWKFNRYFGMYVIENEVGRFLLNGDTYYRFTDFNEQTPKLLKPKTFGYYWMTRPGIVKNSTGVEFFLDTKKSNVENIIKESVLNSESVFTVKGRSGEFHRIKEREIDPEFQKIKVYTENVEISDFTGFQYDKPIEVPGELLGPNGKAAFAFKIKPARLYYAFPKPNGGYNFSYQTGLEYGSIIQIDWLNNSLPLKINDVSEIVDGIITEPLREIDPDNRILKFPDNIIESRIMGYHMYSDQIGNPQILLDPVTDPGKSYDTTFCQWAQDLPAQEKTAASIIAESIASAFNALPDTPFTALNIDDVVYVVINEPGSYYNGSKFSTTLDSSRYELVKGQDYMGGGSNAVRRIKVSVNDLAIINVGDWVKTKEGYSTIQSISPYIEEPQYNLDEDIIGYTDIDKYVIITIKDGTPVMVDKKLQIFRPLENRISLLSFLDIMDFDSSFNISRYNRSLSYEVDRYQKFDNINSSDVTSVELQVIAGAHPDEPIPIKWMSNLNDNWFETIDLTTIPTTNPEIYTLFSKLDALNTYDGNSLSRIPIIDKLTDNGSISSISYLDVSQPVYIFPFEEMNTRWYAKSQNDVFVSTFASRINMPLLTSSINYDDFKINSNLNMNEGDLLTIIKINSNVDNIKLTKVNTYDSIEIFTATSTESTNYDSEFLVNLNPQVDFDSIILKNFLYKIHFEYHLNYPQYDKFRYYIIRYTYQNVDSYYMILNPSTIKGFKVEGDGLEIFNVPICITTDNSVTLSKYDDWTPFLQAEYETDPEEILNNPDIVTLADYNSSNTPVSLTSNETVDFIGFNHLNNVVTSDPMLAEKQNEYDRLNENYLQEFNYTSKIIPYINKWVFQGSKDIRSNQYRLNASLAFGKLNFSPSYDHFESNTEFFTHEWPYLAEFPINYSDKNLSKSFNYIGLGISYDEFRTKMLDETTDWFIQYFSKKNNKTVRIFPEDLFSKIVWTPEGGAVTVFKGVKLKFNERLESTKLIFDSQVPVTPNSNKYEDYKFTAVLFLKEKASIFDNKSAVEHDFIVNDVHKHITYTIRASIEDYKLNPMQFDAQKSIDYFNLYNLKSQKKIQRRELIYDDVILNGSLIYNGVSMQYKYVEPLYVDGDGIKHFTEGNLNDILNYNRNLTYIPDPYNENTDNNPTASDFIIASRLLDRSNLIIEFESATNLRNAIMLGYREKESDSSVANPTWRYFDSKLWYLPANGGSYPLFSFPDTFTDGSVTIDGDVIMIEDNNVGDTSIQKIFLNTNTGEYISLTYSNNDLYQTVIGDTLPVIGDYGKLNHFLVYPNGGYQFNKNVVDQLSFANINDLIQKNNPKINYNFSNNSSRKIWIQTETPDVLTLTSTVSVSEDPVKPTELTLEPVVGYVTSNVEETVTLLRYSGSYEILLKNVVTFDEDINNLITYSNVKFDVDIPDFGKYEKWFYKVSKDPNILRSTNYPYIDEYALDRKIAYIFKSQWDQEFFRDYQDKKIFTEIKGSRTMTDVQLPLTSKCVKVLKNVRVETFGFTSISTEQSETQLIVRVDLNDALTRYIADQLRSEFNQWVNIETGETNSRDNEENLLKYIQANLLKLYKLNTNELWQLKNDNQDGLVINLNDAQKQANGFIKQSRFASTLLDNVLTITLNLSEVKYLYAVTVTFTRI